MTLKEVEGIIKYKIDEHIKEDRLSSLMLSNLESWREILFDLRLIGEYDDGIGYGNLSMRTKTTDQSFVISASQTGNISNLKTEHYSEVLKFDLETFKLSFSGVLKASSESLTHAAVYHSNKDVCYVFHVHDSAIWKYMLKNDLPKISENVTYGTKEMADACASICQKSPFGVVVMAGHEDGLFSYGTTANEAGKVLLELYLKVYNES